VVEAVDEPRDDADLLEDPVLARVPLASGLLTGKLTKDTVFDESDHRRFNRHGEAFDVGETFAGVDYETGLAVVDELRALVPAGATLAQMALRWILMSETVTAAIPGAKTPEQARANAAAADREPLPGTGPAARPPALVAAGWQRPGRPLRDRRPPLATARAARV
jgi:aryl-alcohol dehydrogenase-like predicted oxidoreductase